MPITEVALYGPGGYCPVHLNDVLQNKYRIIHKLGHGDDGMVWLCLVEQPPTPPTTPPTDIKPVLSRYISLKILRANLSTDSSNKIPEFLVFQHLRKNSRFSSTSPSDATTPAASGSHELPHPGQSHVIRLLDSFEILSGNGIHLCLVMPFAGFTVRDVKGLEIWKRKSIGKQVALGVAYLHEKGVCHADLTATNVLLDLDTVQDWTVEDIFKNLGAPQQVPFPSSVTDPSDSTYPLADLIEGYGVPSPTELVNFSYNLNMDVTTRTTPAYTVPSISSPFIPTYLFGTHVTIIDLGASFLFSDTTPAIPRPSVPIFYPAPESVFNLPITKAVDVWCLACLIFQIYTGEILFHGPYYGGFAKESNEEDALRSLREVMGAVPGDIAGVDVVLTEVQRGMAVMGSVRCIPKEILFWRIWQAVGDVEARAMKEMWDLMGGMLMYNPTLRIGAEQASRHPWFT